MSSDTNSVLFYRGHGDSKYTLAPSIFRNSGWVTNEHVMFHELALRCPGDFHNSKSTFNSLVKMQHYSLPTRLLDITSNPLIALYFACAGSQSEEGEVIVFSVKKSNIKYYDSDTVSVVSNISRMHSSFAIPEEADPSKFNKLQEVDSLVREIQREKPYFEPRIKPEDINTVLCVKPILDNPRIIKQDGAFFLFGMGKDKTIPAEIPNNLLVSKDKNRLLIPSHNKSKILKQLELLGVSRSSIFPEIEHVANFIKESYKDK
nr:FRG domain-containing protein [Pseudomonas sp. 8O]